MVEQLINDLILRKCRFQILCFDQNEFLCVPAAADNDDVPKYRLARTVIMRHLLSNVPGDCVVKFYLFESLNDKEFGKFLEVSDAYFIMIHDGAVAGHLKSKSSIDSELKEGLDTICGNARKAAKPSSTNTKAPTRTIAIMFWLRVMISWFLAKLYNVALINEMQFLDSKVWDDEATLSTVANLALGTDQYSRTCQPQKSPRNHTSILRGCELGFVAIYPSSYRRRAYGLF